MVRYQVVRRDLRGRHRGSLITPGAEPVDAVRAAEARFRPRAEPVTYDVYRLRRLRRPRYMVTVPGDAGEGLAGVREPRRPRHDPPGLRADRSSTSVE